MKRSKKLAAKSSAKNAAKKNSPAESAPPKLYRPFEKLAKDARDAKAKEAREAREPKEAREAKEAREPKEAKKDRSKPGSPPVGVPAASKAHGASPPPSDPRAKSGVPRGAAKGNKTVAYASAAAKAAHEKAEGAHSSEDSASFALYMAGVRALDDKATRIPLSANRLERAAKGSLPAPDADAPAREQFQALVVEGIRFETSDDGERIEGRRIEVEPREVRRLRRGQYTVDQQVDLHGLTAFEARKAMETFIEKRRKEGDRVLRIIHGKGAHSPRGVSVLRGEIAAWLSQGPAKRHIAAFATAPDGEGGAGALLVLLMRPHA